MMMSSPSSSIPPRYLLALLDHGNNAALTLPIDRLPKGLMRRLQLVLDLALLDVTALHFFPSTLAAAALGLLLPAERAPALAACTVRRRRRFLNHIVVDRQITTNNDRTFIH